MTNLNPPREGFEQVAGVTWLARMIDKARLAHEGTIDHFDLDYPCPMDQRLLSQMGIDGETFQKIVIEAQSDEKIVAALKTQNALPIS